MCDLMKMHGVNCIKFIRFVLYLNIISSLQLVEFVLRRHGTRTTHTATSLYKHNTYCEHLFLPTSIRYCRPVSSDSLLLITFPKAIRSAYSISGPRITTTRKLPVTDSRESIVNIIGEFLIYCRNFCFCYSDIF